MKRKIKTFGSIALVTFLLASCDIVKDPVIEQTGFLSDLYDVPDFPDNTNDNRNVMIEDFTGHLCGNCPGAAVIARDLMEDFPGQVFTLAIHAGSLAEPLSGPEFTTDWRAPESDFYYAQLEIQAYPLGRVNRELGFGGVLPPSLWRSTVEQLLDDNDLNIKMQLVAEYHDGPSHLNTHVETEFINSLQGSYNVVVCLIESHMEDWQLNYVTVGDPDYPVGDVEDYEFNHVFRGTVNGALGEMLYMDPQAGNLDITSYTYEFNMDWVAENTHVIAYVYNTETGLIENVVESEIEIIK